jgi:hypothetical protein
MVITHQTNIHWFPQSGTSALSAVGHIPEERPCEGACQQQFQQPAVSDPSDPRGNLAFGALELCQVSHTSGHAVNFVNTCQQWKRWRVL